MAQDFTLPDLGEGVHEGEVIRWLVREGEHVRLEQPLVEVMTDKVTAEIPSPFAGTVLKIAVPEGAVVPVGTVLISIGEPGEAVETDGQSRSERPAAAGAGAGASPAARPAAPGGDGGAPVLALPAVRKLARELGVNLEEMAAGGGRITLSDVRRFAQERSRSHVPPAGAAAEGKPAAAPREPAELERVPLRGRRRMIARHLVEASTQLAPFTLVEECDLTGLVALRERVRPLVEAQGVHLTYLPFIITAVVAALREHPMLNATVDAATGDLVVSRDYHIGIATDTADGLIVPVIRDAGRVGVIGLAREVERLVGAARAGRLDAAEAQGSTFTITSLGRRGGVMATPIINIPEVAILSVQRIAPRPAVWEGQIAVRQLANISLTFDHRYIDGAVGADFAATLTRYLQDPAVLMFWLAELRGQD